MVCVFVCVHVDIHVCIHRKYVDNQLFINDYYTDKPLPPKSGSCVTYNWERIECYWDLSVEYRQLHGITDTSVDYSL